MNAMYVLSAVCVCGVVGVPHDRAAEGGVVLMTINALAQIARVFRRAGGIGQAAGLVHGKSL